MKKTRTKQTTYWLSVIVIGAALGLALQFARAWTEPTTAPPGGNVGAPLNTGSSEQTKSAGLILLGNTRGLWARGTDYGVAGTDTDTGAYGLLGNSGYGGVFNGPVYANGDLQATGNIWAGGGITADAFIARSAIHSNAGIDASGRIHASDDICTDLNGGKCLSNQGSGSTTTTTATWPVSGGPTCTCAFIPTWYYGDGTSSSYIYALYRDCGGGLYFNGSPAFNSPLGPNSSWGYGINIYFPCYDW